MAAARSKLGRMIERGYNAGGAMNLHDIVMEIHGRAGSDRRAAAMVGVHHRTWQRWRKGQAKPNVLHLMAVTEAARKVRADMKPLDATNMKLKTVGKDGRRRTIHGHQLGFGAAASADIERAYIRGGGDEAARAFMDALRGTPSGRDFYADYFQPLSTPDEIEDLFDDLQYEGDDNDMDAYSAGAGSASW